METTDATISAALAPRLSDAQLHPFKNSYIVRRPDALLYDYYTITTKPGPTPNLVLFDKRPPVLCEGLVVINKQFYEVSVRDLLRGRILVSKLVKPNQPANSGIGSSTSPVGRKHNKPVSIPGQNEPRAIQPAEDEISQAADMAWSEQIGTLLDTVYSKEGEWEVTPTP